MARSVPSPLVVPALRSTGRSPIAETPLQQVRDACVTLYEELVGGLVADYHPDGLTDGTAVSLYYRLPLQKREGTGTTYPQLRVVVWATNSAGADRTLQTDIDGATEAHAVVPAGTATITAYSSDHEWPDAGLPGYSDLEVIVPADVTVYGVSVYDYRGRATLDPGVYTSGVAIPDSATWDAEKPCSVAHYLDLVLLARTCADRHAGAVLASCRQSSALLGGTVRVPLPVSSTPGGQTLSLTWYVMGSGSLRYGTEGGSDVVLLATSGYGTWDGPYELAVYVPQDAVARPALLDIVPVWTLGDIYAVSAWWNSAPAQDANTGPTYIATETPKYLVTETGARLRL